MSNLNVRVSGSLPEKAMLVNVLNDMLVTHGFKCIIQDKIMDETIKKNVVSCCSIDLENIDPTIILELENLQNANITTDLTKLYNELNQAAWAGKGLTWNHAIDSIREEIRKILLIPSAGI